VADRTVGQDPPLLPSPAPRLAMVTVPVGFQLRQAARISPTYGSGWHSVGV
jgi:hypothetical protein